MLQRPQQQEEGGAAQHPREQKIRRQPPAGPCALRSDGTTQSVPVSIRTDRQQPQLQQEAQPLLLPPLAAVETAGSGDTTQSAQASTAAAAPGVAAVAAAAGHSRSSGRSRPVVDHRHLLHHNHHAALSLPAQLSCEDWGSQGLGVASTSLTSS